MFESCATGSSCLFRDYDAFLTVAFAVNVSISAWWRSLYEHVNRMTKTKAELNRKMVPRDIALDEERRRDKCEAIVEWCGRSVRVYSALMAFVIGATLLLLRSDTTICFWCVASTTIGVFLLVLINVYHRVHMFFIGRSEKKFVEGFNAAVRELEHRSKQL